MHKSRSDYENFAEDLRSLFLFIKRPQHWHKISALAKVDLDRPSAQLLMTLYYQQNKPCRVQDIAALLGVEAPSVTRKSQELELKGLLKRTTDPADKRAVQLLLTRRGRTLVTKVRQAQAEAIGTVMKRWPKDERRHFARLFEKFTRQYIDEGPPHA